MKNIHILPTDKPSRLAKHSSGSFHIVSYIAHKKGLYKMTNQYIYITSDENPKNKDYYWDENKRKVKRYFESRESFPSLLHRFKVIITTDQDLIKDGVQAIDDEFLEWFVKNPSCESVEIVNDEYVDLEKDEYVDLYKIIIPQENPKQ
jgi:hypothetical protein